MKIIQALFILAIIIVTIYISALQPKLHKHFILSPDNFKLSSVNQRPQDTQSIVLFKIGDVNTEISREETKIDTEEVKRISEEAKIIPSSFISSTSEISKNTNTSTSSAASNSSTSANNSNDMLEQVANMINNKNTNPEAQRYISKFGDYNNNRNTSINDINKRNNDKNNNVTSESPKACPVCGDMKNPKYRNELIAWNEWRSRIQNQIMDDSDVDANYGTIFYFTFKVDKNRNIYNVKVICTDPTNSAASSAVRKAIMRLRGKAILEFPKGTNRNMVDFTGGFLIGTYSQYSSPGDYHDYENIRRQY